ncbi:CPBP family intramembrane metalloprotease [Bacillus sp. Xin]|uniref:CPBP family intramembrane glutamic endopeptidase n=1 Tax=unclassified Bacillus (in: firmicutes) TaxID=185979 RepID=UPI0015720BBE|nr:MULTISPECIES: CPBP family intramembrane glutamic endopeptidase [unclassified Bacillus (in: firmicutes)]MBC6971843.1 CPBP family intramembrane metalloprotease [Bacillus sp. Xin]NSW37992.1 CPBP family intramembrane metalloprotease [Bacillus sp. Xin1]
MRSQWTSIFRKLVPKDVLTIIGTYLVNIIVTLIMANIIANVFGGVANPAARQFEGASWDAVLFFLKTIPMLFGEGLLTILPFLIILKLSVQYFKVSRKTGIVIAWLITSIIFGAIHLPTYNWNFTQAILGIGLARFILTYPYIKTKNIWVSFIIHVVNDWTIFGIAFLLTIH